MSTPFIIDVNRDTTGRYTASLIDETGAAVPVSAVASLTLTLTDRATGTVINGRTNQSILNTNGGTLDASGNLTLTFSQADNAILSANSPEVEVHMAIFTWTYALGNKGGRHVVIVNVYNTTLGETA